MELNQLITDLHHQPQQKGKVKPATELSSKKSSENLRRVFRERYREFEVTEVVPDSVLSRDLKCEELIDSYSSTTSLTTKLKTIINEFLSEYRKIKNNN